MTSVIIPFFNFNPMILLIILILFSNLDPIAIELPNRIDNIYIGNMARAAEVSVCKDSAVSSSLNYYRYSSSTTFLNEYLLTVQYSSFMYEFLSKLCHCFILCYSSELSLYTCELFRWLDDYVRMPYYQVLGLTP